MFTIPRHLQPFSNTFVDREFNSTRVYMYLFMEITGLFIYEDSVHSLDCNFVLDLADR